MQIQICVSGEDSGAMKYIIFMQAGNAGPFCKLPPQAYFRPVKNPVYVTFSNVTTGHKKLYSNGSNSHWSCGKRLPLMLPCHQGID